MKASDVLLLTSRHEGMPGVVIEACAAGLDVIACDLPGVLEIAEHLTGITAVPRLAPDDVWADALASALSRSSGESMRVDLRARFASSRFSIASAAREMRTLWLQ
jgi:glycosyltransferase involved in cell wall biosynthesis